MEGIDAFIMQQFLKSSYQADVITGLMENYQHLTYEEAVKYVSNLLDQLQLSDLNKQTKIKINSHPGFYTSIIQYQIVTAGNFEINIENIDNIYYLDNIDKMVDSLLRLLLYKKSEPNTNVPSEEITKLCKKVKDVKRYGVPTFGNSFGSYWSVKEVEEKPLKPKSNFGILPLYYFKSEIFDSLKKIKRGRGNEYQLTDAIQKLIDDGKNVVAIPLNHNEIEIDVGTVESYRFAQEISYKKA